MLSISIKNESVNSYNVKDKKIKHADKIGSRKNMTDDCYDIV